MSEKRIGLFGQLFPPKPTWTTADVPDQTGKVVIVTGGSGGIGQETSRVRAPFLPPAPLCIDYEGDIQRYCSLKALKCISRRVHKKSLRK